jgi:hypothetical protein
MTTPSKPSELCARSTYLTRSGRQLQAPNDGPVLNGGLATPMAQAAGFEIVARISPNAGWLPYFGFAFHFDTAVGLYILLLDQVQSDDQSNAPSAAQPTLVANGDPALVTIGPTVAAGSTGVWSESETEAHTFKRIPRQDECLADLRDYAGFPFDRGCYATLSTTPGIVTFPVGPNEGPVLGGVRYTARWQGQR